MHNMIPELGSPAPLPPALRSEGEIIGTWRTTGTPVVSICCATYNHALYIEDALRGFLAQETTFPFEILIRDDASTDGTADIAREYAAKYPRIIRTILEQENQYSKGVRPNPAMLPFVRGMYVALCEGDDYWIARDKLEKQVALLSACAGCSMAVAQTVACKNDESGNLVCGQVMGANKDFLDFEDVKKVYVHTSTYLIRTDWYKRAVAKFSGKISFSDTALRYILADMGPFVQLKEVVSVYRQTGSGLWSSLGRIKQIEWEIELAESFHENFGRQHRQYFGEKLYKLYGLMLFGGKFAFNNKSMPENIVRYIQLALKFWTRRSISKFLRLINKVMDIKTNGELS